MYLSTATKPNISTDSLMPKKRLKRDPTVLHFMNNSACKLEQSKTKMYVKASSRV